MPELSEGAGGGELLGLPPGQISPSDHIREGPEWRLRPFGDDHFRCVTAEAGDLDQTEPHRHRAVASVGQAGFGICGRFIGPAQPRAPRTKRPRLMEVFYALRHAAVSTWLRTTGDAALVAQWAGHSVPVLLKVYAKAVAGTEQETLDRIWNATRRHAENPHPGHK